MLLIEHFETSAKEHPEEMFLHFVGETPKQDVVLSYAEANKRSSALARILLEAGIGHGDVVAVLLPNCANWLPLYFAIQKLGGVTCTLNPVLSAGDLARCVAHAGAKIVVCIPELTHKLAEIRQNGFGGLAILVNRSASGAICDTGRHLPWNENHMPRSAQIQKEDILSIVFTSGTTSSKPKAVLEPIGSIVRGIRSYQQKLNLQPGERIMVVTPLFHAAALNWAVTIAVLVGGGIVLTERFSARLFWGQALRAHSSVLWTVAAILSILLLQPVQPTEREALSDLRMIFGVAAGSQWLKIRERWGIRLVDGFGMSETPGTITDDDCFDHSEPYPCIGRPVPGIDLRIVDHKTEEVCPARRIGEIVVRYGQGFAGYLNNPEAMSKSIRNGWFHSEDLAYSDEEGRIYFVDRLKDIIRRGGENIAARDIEGVLAEHPEIMEVTVVAKADAVLGETICAFIVPRVASRDISIEEVQTFCKARLPRYKWPEDVRIVKAEELPRTPTGRVQKFRLKELLREESRWRER